MRFIIVQPEVQALAENGWMERLKALERPSDYERGRGRGGLRPASGV